MAAMESFLKQLVTRIKSLNVGECLLVPGTWIMPEGGHAGWQSSGPHAARSLRSRPPPPRAPEGPCCSQAARSPGTARKLAAAS